MKKSIIILNTARLSYANGTTHFLGFNIDKA